MKRAPLRVLVALSLFAAATSACEPADFLAPSAEDATGAVLSALRVIEGGRMPNTIRFVDFAPGVHRQLVQAVAPLSGGRPGSRPMDAAIPGAQLTCSSRSESKGTQGACSATGTYGSRRGRRQGREWLETPVGRC